jgi:hypothetical protein
MTRVDSIVDLLIVHPRFSLPTACVHYNVYESANQSVTWKVNLTKTFWQLTIHSACIQVRDLSVSKAVGGMQSATGNLDAHAYRTIKAHQALITFDIPLLLSTFPSAIVHFSSLVVDCPPPPYSHVRHHGSVQSSHSSRHTRTERGTQELGKGFRFSPGGPGRIAPRG